MVLNNLSWLYMEQGQFFQALKYSNQAYGLNAEIPNVVDSYAQALLKSDKKPEALAKAKEAYELSKGKNIDIALNYAETLLANKNTEEAKRILSGITGVSATQIKRKSELSN